MAYFDSATPTIYKVTTSASPTFHAFYAHHPVMVTCDSGATSSLVRQDVAVKLGMPLEPTSHTASQADGKTTLTPCGEVHVTLTRNDLSFSLQAIVVAELDCEILVGVPFMKCNDIVLDLPHDRIIIRDKLHISYTPGSKAGLPLGVRRSQSFLLKSSIKQVILPGDYIELKSPSRIHDNTTIAIEPRCDTGDSSWLQPVITKSIGGVVRVPNLSPDPVSVNKNQHLAQVHYTTTTSESPPPSLPRHMNVRNIPGTQVLHSKDILVDPDHQLFTAEQQAFNKLHARYDLVFNPQIGKYNDASGHIRASINMGPVQPPSHKARLPSYNTDKLQLLQEKMDQLEELGSPG